MNSTELADKIFDEMSKSGASGKISDVMHGIENVKDLLENALKESYNNGWQAHKEHLEKEKTNRQKNQN